METRDGMMHGDLDGPSDITALAGVDLEVGSDDGATLGGVHDLQVGVDLVEHGGQVDGGNGPGAGAEPQQDDGGLGTDEGDLEEDGVEVAQGGGRVDREAQHEDV